MKSIIIDKPFSVSLVDEEIPKAGPGEIVVKAEMSGISSGTEMFLYRGTYPNFRLKKWGQWKEYPVRPGYELVGKVVEVGPQLYSKGDGAAAAESLQAAAGVIVADTDEFAVGDRVICMGTHQEYTKVPATLAVKVPDNVSSEVATLTILTTTTMHSTRRLELEYGSTVAVIGLGVVGNLALQHAKLAGCSKVIGIDLDEGRCQMARDVGADYVINSSKEDPVKKVLEITNGIGADAVVEASGAKGTLRLGLDLMRDRGTVEILGWHTDEPSFEFGDLYFKEGKIIATRAIGPDVGIPYSYVRWGFDQNLRLAMDLIQRGKIKTDFFTPQKFHYTEIDKVYKMIHENPASIGLQAILEW